MENCVKETIRFLSSDGKTQVAAYFYTPNHPPKAVIQISHGMCEYIGRYEHMIDRLCGAGFACCGNDHLGHGDTESEQLGFFAEEGGEQLVLKDLYTMNTLAREKYPNLPYILYGHSMGSFFARWFAEKNPDAQDLLIISGTGGPGALMKAGQTLAGFLCRIKGPRYVSQFMRQVSTGSYGKHFEGSARSVWLTRDSSVWPVYDSDEKCQFTFSVSAYRDMLLAYNHVNDMECAKRYRKDLPMLLVSGDKDPVGAFGKGVKAAYELLKKGGVEDVTLRLYPDGRHEMHNELNKEEVFGDMIAWCEAHI